MRKYSLVTLALFILIPEAVGFLGSFFVSGSIDAWYAVLAKPAFSPPNWLFAPVWTILYALMGLAAYRIWMRRQGKHAQKALTLFALQLVLNGIWTPVFFGARDIDLALVIIIVLLIAILLTTIWFFRVDRVAGFLMIPYVAWVAFAALLNTSLFLMN